MFSPDPSDEEKKLAAEEKVCDGAEDLEDTETETEDGTDGGGKEFQKKLQRRRAKKRKHCILDDEDMSRKQPELKRTKLVKSRTASETLLIETPAAVAARAGCKPAEVAAIAAKPVAAATIARKAPQKKNAPKTKAKPQAAKKKTKTKVDTPKKKKLAPLVVSNVGN